MTDINQDQQYGVAFAISKPTWRAEVMALLGNYSVHPDAYRERGASGYVEFALAPASAVGISALAARSDASLVTRLPTLRQAYGTFLRTAPWHPLVLQAELDLLLDKQLNGAPLDVGHAEWLQADLEVVRGVHLVGALEGMKAGGVAGFQRGVWGGLWWFVAPHLRHARRRDRARGPGPLEHLGALSAEWVSLMRTPPLLLLGLVLGAPLAARATPDFPAAIARDLQLSAPPPCTICHATNQGGAGTVTKPFGKYLVSRGLVPFDESSLATALAAAAGEQHDSNGDGISDIDALKQGLDPNGSPSPVLSSRILDSAVPRAAGTEAPGWCSLP